MISCDFGGEEFDMGRIDSKQVIYSRVLQMRFCKQLGGDVEEMEKYFELLIGAFQQCGAVSPASLSNRKLPPSLQCYSSPMYTSSGPLGPIFKVRGSLKVKVNPLCTVVVVF